MGAGKPHLSTVQDLGADIKLIGVTFPNTIIQPQKKIGAVWSAILGTSTDWENFNLNGVTFTKPAGAVTHYRYTAFNHGTCTYTSNELSAP